MRACVMDEKELEMLDKVLRTANRKCYYVGIILLLHLLELMA